MTTHAILTTVSERPGMLHAVTRVLAAHSADIKYVDIHAGDPQSEIYLEFTLPLVGEHELAAAVRAAARLPRVKLLVLAGSIMGGEITRAVEEVRRNGLQVISLNMAGSVPDAADL